MCVSESETIVVYTCMSLVGWRLRASRLWRDEHLKTAQYMKEGASKDSTMMEGASKDGTMMEGASKDGRKRIMQDLTGMYWFMFR